MRMIREVAATLIFGPETKLATLKDRVPIVYAELIARTDQRAFRDVLPRFHTVRRRSISPSLYESQSKAITLSGSAFDELRSFADAIDFMALGAWVRFTEQFSSAPRLFEKLEGHIQRRSLSRYRRFLLKYQKGRCFYCEQLCEVDGTVDHVIPWSFVAEDRIWNLVLSCMSCNSGKSDRLPTSDFIQNVVKRSGAFLPAGGLAHPFQMDVREYFDAALLAKHIESLAMRCRADEFGEWRPVATSMS
jgi:hypothetical protein